MGNSPVRELMPAAAAELIAGGATLLDTREPHEWKAGHLAGATLLPPADVVAKVEQVVPDKTKTVVVYCAGGVRSLRAAMQMAALGYQDVISMAGGIVQWKQENRPTQLPDETPAIATNPRYARHMVMPEVRSEERRGGKAE